jgi:hypothetical protein
MITKRKWVLVSVLLFSIILFSCSTDQKRIEAIGNALMTSDSVSRYSIPEVVSVGKELIQRIDTLKSNSANYSIRVEQTYFKNPFVNSEEDCWLIIDTDRDDIKIRMKYNKSKDMYDILGWWTL